MPKRRLVTAQCFTDALCVENENGLGKLNIQFRWHPHRLEHTYTDTHTQWTESKRATCHYQQSNHGCCSCLPLYLQTFPPIVSLLVLLPANITLNQTFHNNTSIFVKTPFFFCYLSYFCYKTCTGCLEQQQKYNIQFICNFFCNIHQFIR